MVPDMREENGIVVMELEGKIMGSPQDTSLVNRIDELIEKDKINIVLDFGRVEWMNSRGLGICVSCSTTLHSKGGCLKLACACDKVKELLEKCKMYALLECYETVDDAVKSFAKTA